MMIRMEIISLTFCCSCLKSRSDEFSPADFLFHKGPWEYFLIKIHLIILRIPANRQSNKPEILLIFPGNTAPCSWLLCSLQALVVEPLQQLDPAGPGILHLLMEGNQLVDTHLPSHDLCTNVSPWWRFERHETACLSRGHSLMTHDVHGRGASGASGINVHWCLCT